MDQTYKDVRVTMTKDKVLLYQHPKEEKTPGGIVLAETDTQKAEPIADVIAVGPKVQLIFVGDVVVFGTYAGTFITIDKFEYLILREEDILATMENFYDN